MDRSTGVNRRSVLRGTAAAAIGTGFALRFEKVAAMQPSPYPSALSLITGQPSHGSENLLLPANYGGMDRPPRPAAFDRMPLDWNRQRVAVLRAELAKQNIQNFLLRNQFNHNYFLGYWALGTERPQLAFMNAQDKDPWFFYPALDRDLVSSWWFGGGKMYFDVREAEGAMPNHGTFNQGKEVDLFVDMLEGLRDHGISGQRIGIDAPLLPSEEAKLKATLPGIEFVDISATVLGIKRIKTPEELALWSRAYTYSDRAHAFARDYILTHGTEITDLEVAHATEMWVNNLIYSQLDLADGAPNHGVGIGVLGAGIAVTCIAGRPTAYPEPNQPIFRRIGPNVPVSISVTAKIGGCGGPSTRTLLLADKAGQFDPHMTKLWEVSRQSCDIQLAAQKAGASASDVAYAVHKYQLAQGVQAHVRNRPGTSLGWEGNQAPFLSLGDYTKLAKDMCISQEPSLYDPTAGGGIKWNDTVVTGVNSGYRMSRVPYSKEWSFIKL